MSRTKQLFVAFAILLVTLTACAPQPVSTGTNTGSGNQQQTTIVIEGDNTGDITVNQGIVESNDSSTTNAAAPAATEAPAPTEAPATVADPKVCYYFGWHDGWIKEVERVHTNGVLNRNEVENGMSLQAPWSEWTTATKVDGFVVTPTEELNNDAIHGIACGDLAYMFGRTDASDLPFWKVSYIQLTSNGLLACEDDVNTSNHGWSGTCSGDTVVVEGIPLDEVTVTDFQDDWDSLVALMNSWDGPTPQYGTIEEAWVSKK